MSGVRKEPVFEIVRTPKKLEAAAILEKHGA